MILPEKTENTKDFIIRLLADKWPMTIRKIYFSTKKHHKVSYHAVYKIVKQLVKDGILEANGNKEYCLDKNWIGRMSEFVDKLKSTYTKRVSGQPNTLVFNTVADVDNYFMGMASKENEIKIVQCKHLWWALFRPETAYFRMEKDKLYKNRTYVLCSGKTEIDRWCALFEGKLKKNIRLGIEFNNNCDVFMRGDSVFEVFYPQSLMYVLDKEYTKTKSVGNLNLKKLIKNFYRKPSKIIMTINKNRKVANHIRNITMSCFP